jgi:hypothetical protein
MRVIIAKTITPHSGLGNSVESATHRDLHSRTSIPGQWRSWPAQHVWFLNMIIDPTASVAATVWGRRVGADVIPCVYTDRWPLVLPKEDRNRGGPEPRRIGAN